MTQSATEIFTMQLARAAGRQAQRYLRSQGLQKSDRDDVIASALLWCWEHRENYSLTTTLETWFMNAVRDAHKNLQRDALPGSEEPLGDLAREDETYNSAAAESAATALLGAMTPADRTVAGLVMRGYTQSEMIARGIPEWSIRNARSRIRQLRRLVPDEGRARQIARTAAHASPDEVDGKLSEIDVALEKLEFAPPAGKDCPPCWRCMWFEGYTPARKRQTRMQIEDPEVRAAVKETEARKVQIAQQVRGE